MAVASAGPYASLHLAPYRQPRQHPTTQFFTGRMPFLPPNQQRQSTEGLHNCTGCTTKRSMKRTRGNQAIGDIRCCPWRVSLKLLHFRVTDSRPLRADMTSSAKPEINNVSQRRQRRTEPRPQTTHIINLVMSWRVISETSSRTDMWTDRQTDNQAHRNTPPPRAELQVKSGFF